MGQSKTSQLHADWLAQMQRAERAEDAYTRLEMAAREVAAMWKQVDQPDRLAQEALDRLEPCVDRLREVLDA